MKLNWIVAGAAVLALVAAEPALARVKQKAQRQCVDRSYDHSLSGFLWNPAPRPNGCAPAVYQYGRYIGQDPDPFIRQQLRRDPQTGYSQF